MDERNWSVYGQIHTRERSRLKHATADKLVFNHEALHLRQKRQSAAVTSDVAPWDTDSNDDDDDAEHAALDLSVTDLPEEDVLLLMR